MNHRHTKTNRAAFTLLELLIASGLAATLMVLVWSLFSVYSKLSDKGAAQATELQLVRALMRQIRSDLHHVRAHPQRPAKSFPQFQDRPAIRTAGEMRGSESSLRLVVREPRDNEAGRATALEIREINSPNVYNIVQYAWRPNSDEKHDEKHDEQHEEQRKEQPIEQSVEPAQSVGLTRRVIPRTVPLGQPLEQEDRVPEVVRLRFRYFDGNTWQNGWDSRGRGMPVAIEIAFDLQPKVDREPIEADEQAESDSEQGIETPQAAGVSNADTNEADTGKALADKVDEADQFEYRFVVVLNAKRRAGDHEEALLP